MKPMLRHLLPLVFFVTCAGAEDFQGSDHPLEYDREPINYSDSKPEDAITALQAKIASGEVKLEWDDKFGYLPSVLKALKVPVSSQTLVFSKTSLQRKLISPDNPRALYFNDDVYIGYVPGAPVMELSAADPKLGGTFYTLEQEKVRKPKFERGTDCLSCHGGQRSLGVPGHVLRSVLTDPTGELNTLEEVRDINQCTPIEDRWAGWYVTGKHGTQPHRGNLIGTKDLRRFKEEPLFKANLTSLKEFFDEGKVYGKGSDIVALMILEHQGHMHNYIARLNIEARQMLAAYGHVRYMRSQVDAFLRYLLFAEEVALTAPIEGNPEYVASFTASAIRDSKGRSLRDLDLQQRMFKYPCSYLIYSQAFDAMAPEIKEVILQKLHDILTGKNQDEQFARVSAEDRKAVLEILVETKANLPDYWKQTVAAGE
jgi:hypothetical protein